MSNTTTPDAGNFARAPLELRRIPPHRILVAEDEAVIRSLITVALERSGYEVDSAPDGAVAWSALQAKHYDLLVTDNSMPKITGIGLVKLLRDHASTLPVVMATGAAPTEDLERYPWLGISAILLKPHLIEDLLKTVKQTLLEAGNIAGNHRLFLEESLPNQ